MLMFMPLCGYLGEDHVIRPVEYHKNLKDVRFDLGTEEGAIEQDFGRTPLWLSFLHIGRPLARALTQAGHHTRYGV